MQQRIETSTKLNRISEEIRAQHKGFHQWDDSYTSKHDHDTILQVSFRLLERRITRQNSLKVKCVFY